MCPHGLNNIGLRRRGFSSEEIKKLKEIYSIIFLNEHNLTQAKEIVIEKYDKDPLANTVLEFLNESTRGIIK